MIERANSNLWAEHVRIAFACIVVASGPIISCYALIAIATCIPEEQALPRRIEFEALTHMPISSHQNSDRPT